MIDYGASCAQDSGTPIELVKSTVDSDSKAVHVIDTGIAGTYEITSKCRDGAGLASETATQTGNDRDSTQSTAPSPGHGTRPAPALSMPAPSRPF